MNILYIYSSNINPQKGGCQRVTKVLCDYFRHDGHNCYYLSKQNTTDGIDFQYVLPERKILHPNNVKYIKDLLREKSIDVVVNQDGLNKKVTKLVHISCYNTTYIITVAHNSLLAPVIYFGIIHSTYFKRLHLSWLTRCFSSYIIKQLMYIMYKIKYKEHYLDILRYSERFVLLSDSYKKELSFFVPSYKKEKVVSIPNPCTLRSCTDVEYPKKNVILYVGRISYEQKRNDILLKIWSRIEPVAPHWTLKIVGDGEDLNTLVEMSRKLRLERAEFLGSQDPCNYYKEAKLFCLTSAYEGFPLVFAEAMNNRCVPFCFNSFGSAKDVIEDGRNGYLVTPFNIDEYTQKLLKLIENENLLVEMANQAQIGSTRFNIDVVVQQWYSIFK